MSRHRRRVWFMPQHRRRVWWLRLRFMSPGFMCLVFMCLRVMRQRKLGVTVTTVGTVAKSAGSTARRSGGEVAGGGSVISGGTDRLRPGRIQRPNLAAAQAMLQRGLAASSCL